MSTKTGTCPHCHTRVPMTHNGTEQGFDERTDPWVFAPHKFDDQRGDTIFRLDCPTAGQNAYTAANGW